MPELVWSGHWRNASFLCGSYCKTDFGQWTDSFSGNGQITISAPFAKGIWKQQHIWFWNALSKNLEEG
jgi:hypothetical protein